MKSRFNHNATTIPEAIEYMHLRAKQLLKVGYRLDSISGHEWGISAFFVKDLKTYQSIYLLEGFRGKNLYKGLVTHPILTSFDCHLSDYLLKHEIEFMIEDLNQYWEYYHISDYYRDQKAKRSGVYFMNHIDEGLAILQHIGASETAKKAYCLHPIYQTDEDVSKAFQDRGNLFITKQDVLLTAMEYRSVANEYLSNRKINSIDEIRLSPLKDVNDMLIADKVQNRKDFELYHQGKHERSDELSEYFDNWIKRLKINYDELVSIIL